MPDRVALGIPRSIHKKLQDVIERLGFQSVNESIIYVLRELLAERVQGNVTPLTTREVGLIRQRLRSLGYLDSFKRREAVSRESAKGRVRPLVHRAVGIGEDDARQDGREGTDRARDLQCPEA